MSGRASTPRPPIYRRLSVVNSPNSPISGRNPGGELTAPIKRRNTAVFRRQPRSRVQDARGFFFLGEVFVFLLWSWVWLVFLSVLSCFVLVDCFWLRIDSFSVCVLFWLCFSFLCSEFFVLPALSICISVYLGPSLSPTAIRAERTFTYLKSLKTYLKSLCLPKVHTSSYLKSTQVIHRIYLKSTVFVVVSYLKSTSCRTYRKAPARRQSPGAWQPLKWSD